VIRAKEYRKNGQKSNAGEAAAESNKKETFGVCATPKVLDLLRRRRYARRPLIS
jgi:hypothetical protein